MAAFPIYRTQVLPEWIDFNQHLRDAYYVLIASFAADALMDHLGMDAAYRQRTRCTLYTLEMHVHYLHEVKQSDLLDVTVRVVGADRKRLHVAFEMYCARYSEPAASIELMLLHVKQDESVASLAFPPEILRAVEALQGATAGITPEKIGSRKMQLPERLK